jgi:hypothetical protein
MCRPGRGGPEDLGHGEPGLRRAAQPGRRGGLADASAWRGLTAQPGKEGRPTPGGGKIGPHRAEDAPAQPGRCRLLAQLSEGDRPSRDLTLFQPESLYSGLA